MKFIMRCHLRKPLLRTGCLHESLRVNSPGSDKECGEEHPRQQQKHVKGLKAVSVVLIPRMKAAQRCWFAKSEGEHYKTWVGKATGPAN